MKEGKAIFIWFLALFIWNYFMRTPPHDAIFIRGIEAIGQFFSPFDIVLTLVALALIFGKPIVNR